MEKNQKEKLSKPKIAILVTFALVLLFIFTFGCYGCSYQPVFEEPTVEEAIDVVSRLAGNRWVIDDTEGIPPFAELFGLCLKELSFGSAAVQASELEATLTATNKAVLYGRLVFDEEGGFSLHYDGQALPITINYSQSRDGNSEMVTLVGQESNTHCYYLKR
ncbi:MAG: hypothetical protein GX626_10210 [Spirochaetales bacterium]|jgi:hypothetical protein|nr:hypothetical protein [Spirochaetales bacterium]